MFVVPSGSVVSTYVLSFPVALDMAIAILGVVAAGAFALLWAVHSRTGSVPPRPPHRHQPPGRMRAVLGTPGVQAA